MADRRIISRIQNRRGKRENLPQPLSPGEVAFTTDTRQVWIGADPDITPPGMVVYVNRSISTAQNILNTKIIEARFDNTFTQASFNSIRNNLIANATYDFVEDDFDWDQTLRVPPASNFEGYAMYIVADQNINVNHTLVNIQSSIQNSVVGDKLISINYVGNVTPFGGTFNSNGDMSLYSHEQALILIGMVNRIYSGSGTGGIVRSNLNIEVVAGIGREGLQIDVQPTIGPGTIDNSLLDNNLQGRINLIDGPDTLPNSVAQRLAQEALARAAAIEAEAAARAAAIAAEANTRQQEIAAEAATRAQALVDEAAARAAAVQAEADARLADFTAEELARNQAIANEAAARAAAIQAEADARALAITNEASARNTAIQAEVANRTAAIAVETNARIAAVSNLQTNLQGQVNSLQATVSDLQGTPEFDTNNDYNIDDIVQYQGGLYRAIQNMVNPSPLPTDVAFWEKIGDFTSLAGAVSANAAAIADQDTRITTAEGNITSISSDVGSLQTSVTGINNTKADITYVDTAVSNETSARTSALSSLETNLQGQINTKASSTDLTTAVSDIYGSQVSAFTNIDARFTSTDNTIATKATQTDINNAVADVYAAEVTQFSNINAELRALDQAANALVIRTDGSKGVGTSTFTSVSGDFIDNIVGPGDTLRISSGGEQGDYTILTVNSASQITVDGHIWASTEVGLSYAILSYGRVKASRTELNQAISNVYGADVSQFTSIEAAINGIGSPDLSAYATLVNLDTAKADIYGSSVEQFTNINTRFTDTDTAINSKASITALNNAVSNIYGSEVSQFTNIAAQFDELETEALAVVRGIDGAKTTGQSIFTSAGQDFLVSGVAVGDTLRITSGGEQGDYTILTVDSANQVTLNGTVWASTETGLTYAIVTFNKIRATRTDLNNAIADVYGAEVTAFTNIDARFTSTDNAISGKASTTDLTTLQSTIYGSTVDQFTNIDARFTSTDAAIDTKATQTDINTAVANVYGAEVTAFTNIDARFTSTDTAINSKASTTDLTTAITNVYGATVDTFTNIDARFTSTDAAIDTKASSTDLSTAIANVYGAQVTEFTNINTRFTSTDAAIDSKATQTDIDNAVSNVYGATVSSFTNIDARFTSVEGDVATRATQTELNTAVSNIYGAEVNQFTNIAAEFSDVETALNAISQNTDGAKTASQATFTSAGSDFIADGVVAGDTLRITSGTEQGDYVILSVDSATQLTLTATLWASTETGLSFSVLSFNKIKATRTELNTAIADVYGAEVSAFTNIQAAFESFTPDLVGYASLTDLDTAKADIYGSQVSQFTNIAAEFQTLDTAVNSVANLTDGSKTVGTSTFTSASATFTQYGLTAGDTLRITSGTEVGDYTIASIDSDTQLTISGHVWASTENTLSFSVLSYFKIKATRTELNDAITDVYGAQVTEFTNINAEFTAVNSDLASKASQTDIDNAVANVYGAQVDQFTNINAAFTNLETGLYAVANGVDGAKTVGGSTFTSAAANFVTDGVTAGDTLRIEEGAEAGDYTIQTVNSGTQITLTGTTWGSTESALNYSILSFGNIKASRDELNTAIADVYGAEVTAFTNIDARFSSTDSTIATKATQTDINTAVADVYGAQVSAFTNIDARFTSTDSDIASKASTQDVVDAKAEVYGAAVTAFTNIDARFTSTDAAIATKASTTDLTTTEANIYGAAVSTFTNIDARFTSTDSAIATKASSTDLTTAITNVYGAQIDEFSNINAEFTLLDSQLNSIAQGINGSKTVSQFTFNSAGATFLTDGVAPGDTLRITTGSDIGDYNIASVGSQTQVTVNGFPGWTATETNVGYYIVSYGKIKATRTELNTAIADVYGAEVSAFTNLDAQFTTVQQDIDSRVTITEFGQGIADVYAAEVIQFTNISARFDTVDGTVAAKADVSYVDTAASTAESEAIAQSTQTVWTALDGPGATESSVQTQATAWSGVASQWEVKATVGELTAGIGLYNDAGTTRFAVQADNFLVYGASVPPTSADAIPFKVVDGTTYIKEAAIEEVSAGKLTAGTIDAALTMTGSLVVDADGFIRSDGVTYNTTTNVWTGSGFWLGDDTGVPKMFIGNSAGNKLTWDGTNLSITGSVTLTNTIPSSDVSGLGSLATASSVDLSTQVTNKSLANLDSSASSKLAGIASGADVTLSAVNGGLTLTGGGLNLSSGTTAIRSGQTAYNTGTGFWLGRDNVNGARFSIGNSTGNRLTWDGSNLNIVGSVTLTNTIPSSDVSGLGSLATANSVDLSTSQVTNKSLANLDSTANTKLAGIAAGADVTLAAINGELAVTGGGINFTSGTAAVRSGKTSYASTANGFWVGMDAGTPKFHFGGATKSIQWTGTDLVLNGEVVGTGNVSAGAITASKIDVDTLAALGATIGFLENRVDGAGTTPYMRLTSSASPIEIFDNAGSDGTRLLGVDTITTGGSTETVLSIKGTFAANSISDANWLSTAGVNALRARLGYIPPLNPSGGSLSQTNITVTTDPQTFNLAGTITSGGAGQGVIASLKLDGRYTIFTNDNPNYNPPVYDITFQYSTNGGSSWSTYGTTTRINGYFTFWPGEPAEGISGVASVGISATATIDSSLPGGAPATSYQWRAVVDRFDGFNLIAATGLKVDFFSVNEEVVGDVAAHFHAATDITTGTLAVARGGTGISSYTTGNYIRASGSTTLEQRTPAQVRADIGAGTGNGTVTSVGNGNGMNFTTITGSGTVTLGTPSTLTPTSTNAVTTSSHTHAVENTVARPAIILKNSSATIAAADENDIWYHNNSTAYTWSLATGMATGYEIQFQNRGTGNITINDNGNTLYWMKGSAPSTGDRTLANGGVATCVHMGGNIWHIYGGGLT